MPVARSDGLILQARGCSHGVAFKTIVVVLDGSNQGLGGASKNECEPGSCSRCPCHAPFNSPSSSARLTDSNTSQSCTRPTWKPEFSQLLPMPNSSMLVLPSSTAPAARSLATAVAS